MKNQLHENLIDSLREVSDLDLAHQLLVNDVTDRIAPWFGTWMLELLNTERSARNPLNADGSNDYTIPNLGELALSDLQAGHGAAVGACKAAYAVRVETVTQFTWRVLELFIGELHARLAEAAHLGLLKTEAQNNG